MIAAYCVITIGGCGPSLEDKIVGAWRSPTIETGGDIIKQTYSIDVFRKDGFVERHGYRVGSDQPILTAIVRYKVEGDRIIVNRAIGKVPFGQYPQVWENIRFHGDELQYWAEGEEQLPRVRILNSN